MHPNIFIGYTNRILNDGLAAILKESGIFDLKHSFALGEAVNIQNSLLATADILILEFDYPKNRDIQLIDKLLNEKPDLKILLISNLPSLKTGMSLLDSGISAYLLKSCTETDIITALNKISAEKSYFCSEITRELIHASNKSNDNNSLLTLRETEILTRLLKCQNPMQIAEELQISENTVKTHRQNVQTKLGVTNILEMFIYALKNNILDITSTEFCSGCPHISKN